MVGKKRSLKEIIESTPHPEIEHSFIKYGGNEPVEVTDYKKSTRLQAKRDSVVENQVGHGRIFSHIYRGQAIYMGGSKRPYTSIHTHPTKIPFLYSLIRFLPRLARNLSEFSALPSEGDLQNFLRDRQMKTMVIAVRDSESGGVTGYNILRKTKHTPNIIDPYFLKVNTRKYEADRKKAIRKRNPELAKNVLDSFVKEYHLRTRMVPSSDYEPNEARTNFVRRKGLEDKIMIFISLILLVAGIFFLSPNITGNIIGVSKVYSNWVGGVLFIVGLVGVFVYFKFRNN